MPEAGVSVSADASGPPLNKCLELVWV